MKRIAMLLALLLIASLAWAQVDTTPAADRMAEVVAEASQQGWLQISPETAITQIDTIGPMVIDVRSQTEWDEQGHLPTATLMPVTEMHDMLGALPANLDTPIVVYCARGTRGNYALMYLKALGYNNVRNLSGGFGAWVDAGLPIER